jgi:hypothetical protein
MPPPAESPSAVQEIILKRLDEVHGAINEVRKDLTMYSQQVAVLVEWRRGVEPQIAIVHTHSSKLDEYGGALRALRWLGGALIAALGALEALLHMRGGK